MCVCRCYCDFVIRVCVFGLVCICVCVLYVSILGGVKTVINCLRAPLARLITLASV